ncbi:glutathione S-transferase family protein [Acuticoccus mangrovi]|uniref:Glutathione S-transferase n=1 Tax=Acuticoccus mangrovi TaxID=2796142 RepID=A0A934IU17_9HYPH|nr:glutathione S-transferase [Acuticoccus mangrovi]MBJ3778035.1 glutathione S-transferase [Acuticoccus mangrovi]
MSGLVLHSSLTSPFGRKVRMAAHVLGIELTIVPASTLDPNDPLRKVNPLGKIPTLVLDDGTVLYDSRTIVEYLDAVGGPALYPASPEARAVAQTHVTLFDGITDAALLLVYEGRFRDDVSHSERWIDHQLGKIGRAFAAAEALTATMTRLDAPAISLVAALGYLDWRRPVAWREAYPRLVAWLEAITATAPAVSATDHLLGDAA